MGFVELLFDAGHFDDTAYEANALAWSTRFNNTFPVLHGDDVRTDYDTNGIPYFPAYWLVDPNGVVRSFGNAFELSPEFVTGHFEAFLSENSSWTQY